VCIVTLFHLSAFHKTVESSCMSEQVVLLRLWNNLVFPKKIPVSGKGKSKLNVKYYFGLEHESQGFGKKWWEVRII
jgi:hypothetical protein